MDPCFDLIGRPFAPGGRGPADFDCYGLVRAVLQRNGIEVPDYPSVADADVNAALILAAMESGWEKVESRGGPAQACANLWPSAAAGLVVLLRIDRAMGTHVGVMVDKDRFLHVLDKTRVVVEKASSPVWRHRVIGYYRWKGPGI